MACVCSAFPVYCLAVTNITAFPTAHSRFPIYLPGVQTVRRFISRTKARGRAGPIASTGGSAGPGLQPEEHCDTCAECISGMILPYGVFLVARGGGSKCLYKNKVGGSFLWTVSPNPPTMSPPRFEPNPRLGGGRSRQHIWLSMIPTIPTYTREPRGGRPLGSGRQLPPPTNCWPGAPFWGGGGGGGGGGIGGGGLGGAMGGGGLREGRFGGGGSRWGNLRCWGGGGTGSPYLPLPSL